MALEVLVHKAARPSVKPPILFVHGAWHGAWCWAENFMPFFSERGYDTYAVDLAGHGNSPGSLQRIRIAHYVANVAKVASELREPPIVVGHSMGGLITQQYLAHHTARAGVLMASVPPRGALGVTLRMLRHHPMAVLRANLTWSLGPIVDDPQRAVALLFGTETDPDQAMGYAHRLQDESYPAYLEMILDRPRPARVVDPVLVIGAADDAIFTTAEVEATARAYGTEAVIFPAMGHDMMLEPRWREPAAAIATWIESAA